MESESIPHLHRSSCTKLHKPTFSTNKDLKQRVLHSCTTDAAVFRARERIRARPQYSRQVLKRTPRFRNAHHGPNYTQQQKPTVGGEGRVGIRPRRPCSATCLLVTEAPAGVGAGGRDGRWDGDGGGRGGSSEARERGVNMGLAWQPRA
ncbi:hypothetical protein Mapa_007998 [Marchantia paleacea]|nr:hypothetical protein Mapa_007998 [Marchantia paleacea]